ncbi:hypothetical protein [Streptomyces virginiae]|uniref:hypothetical protein n=1 Tax=Streptomyces virginiae TaxID=1961 RepID=UPI0036ECBEB3
MFKTLLEQWQANQEQKRVIAADKWEQEKRWREEDREEKRLKQAEQAKLEQEADQKRAEKRAREEETYSILYGAHRRVMKQAATVSYVSLTCHEDTWTFLARRAFGMWSPGWLTSVTQDRPSQGGPVAKDGPFRKDPNLTPGRIVKQDNGMQTIEVSGDNLVTILDRLWETAYGSNIYLTLTDTDPNRAACGPLYSRIEKWLEGLEASAVSKAGHAFVLDERIDLSRAV